MSLENMKKENFSAKDEKSFRGTTKATTILLEGESGMLLAVVTVINHLGIIHYNDPNYCFVLSYQ